MATSSAVKRVGAESKNLFQPAKRPACWAMLHAPVDPLHPLSHPPPIQEPWLQTVPVLHREQIPHWKKNWQGLCKQRIILYHQSLEQGPQPLETS